MGHDTYFELTKRSIPLTKNDGIHLAWCDSVINVRTDKGMHFIEFGYNLECLDRAIDVFEFSLPCPMKSPATALCNSKFINNEMKNYDYTEMIVDSSFWPHNTALTQEMTNIIMSEWSPPFFIENKSVLAILNNIGGVELVLQKQYNWKSVLNLSTLISNKLEYNQSPKNFEELKKSVYTVETSSICWAPQLSPDSSCLLATAQKDGAILFWKIFQDLQPPIIMGQFQTDLPEIVNILWIPKSNTEFVLLCANFEGRLNAFQMQVENGNIAMIKSHVLWKQKDKMTASNLTYNIVNEQVIFFFSKYRHLIVQIVDDNFEVLSQYINNINDHKISKISRATDGFYLSTINSVIFKLNISTNGNSINVSLIPIELKESYPNYELHGFCFSNTTTLCVLGMVDRRLLCRKESFKVDVIFLTTENKLDNIKSALLNNPSGKLTNKWDYIEALRYKTIKSKALPNFDTNLIYLEGTNDIYKLKIYLILLFFYLNLRRVAKISSDYIMPEMSVGKVKEKILLLHAQSVINRLHKKCRVDEVSLTDFEEESLFGCVTYLSVYSKKHKTTVDMDEDVLSILRTDFDLICQSCDDKLSDFFTCNKGHLNMFCMISLTQITSEDYFVCKCCGSTARTDLSVANPLCVFCDLCLVKPE